MARKTVKAIRKGFYEKLRREGAVFSIPVDMPLGKWMVETSEPAPPLSVEEELKDLRRRVAVVETAPDPAPPPEVDLDALDDEGLRAHVAERAEASNVSKPKGLHMMGRAKCMAWLEEHAAC